MTLFINTYERDRVYGGPEEGGWWYDTGTLVESVPMPESMNEADVKALARQQQQALNLQSGLADIPGVGTIRYNGGRYTVLVEDHAGRDFPAERPHYE